MDNLYDYIKEIKKTLLAHSNLQAFLLDDDSEEHFYKNTKSHGIAFSKLPVNKTIESFLQLLKQEYEWSNQYQNISVVQKDFTPIILIGCQHYIFDLYSHYKKG